jgi:hypothetical protein
MKKQFVPYYLFMLIQVSSLTGLKSQDHYSGAAMEKVQLCTDRTMYITGEKILFSAVIFNENGTLAGDLSRILYVEIITPAGTRIAGGKYFVENSSAQGCLQIPEESVTGTYYLKSYTRFMRNGSPDGYSYVMLKIINPDKAEVLTAHETIDTARIIEKGMNEPSPGLSMNISSVKKRYSPRDSVTINIDGSTGKSHAAKLCLSIIPAAAYVDIAVAGKIGGNSPGLIQFYPETRGISITGRLLENKAGRPVPNALINLSVIGDKDVMAIRTDSSGRYFFALPAYSGNRDIFLCAENIQGHSPEIFIENDFCPKPVNLPSPMFRLTKNEKETAYELAVNQSITSKFRQDTVAGEHGPPKGGMPFYGEQTEVLVIDKYIDLPTVEEYFNELPVDVKVRKSEGRKYFRFVTTRTEMTIFDPLVLIDWVAVDDIDRVLALSPKALDRIELVNAPYIKGNITYGGIISFVSKNNDFAGIDLPASGTFINYKFLEACSENISRGPIPANLPDSRNTVYWNPDIRLSDKGSTDIHFTVPDTPGKYIILLRAISSSGLQVVGREEFEVKAGLK